ncbi:MAG: Ig domain-containing protein, partial [Chthoniobacteraceae bacterium]
SILVKDAAGAIVDALSLNNQNVYEPKLGTVGAGRAARFIGDTDFGADLIEEWQLGAASTGTPGNGNTTANSAFVQELRRIGAQGEAAYRLATDSEVVPGLTFDPATGLLSGTPQVPGGGIFNIRIERFTNLDTTAQSFTLMVADESGNVRVPAGKTWAINADTTISGNLGIDGVIQSNGYRLTVAQTLNLSVGGSIENPSGTIEYRQRDGAPITGKTSLLPDPANDATDSDGDGQSNLMEFLLGSNPSSPAERGFFEVSVVDDRLQIEYDEQANSVGAALTPQVSGSLNEWQSGTPHTERVSATGAGPVKRVKVRDLGPGPNRFIRLLFGR